MDFSSFSLFAPVCHIHNGDQRGFDLGLCAFQTKLIRQPVVLPPFCPLNFSILALFVGSQSEPLSLAKSFTFFRTNYLNLGMSIS
jgi:hypothetical protein